MDDFGARLVEILPNLRRYALSLTRDRERAKDLVQATCLRALESRHTYRTDDHFLGWLFRIMHNLDINDRRNRQRRDSATIFDLPQSIDRPQDWHLSFRAVSSALAGMSKERRIVLLMSADGQARETIAQECGIPLNKVRSHLARGRRALRKISIAA